MASPQEITEVLKKIQPLVEQLNGWLKQENMSYAMIKADVAHFLQQKSALLSEIESVKTQLAEYKKEAEGIIGKARNEADRLEGLAREKLVQAMTDRKKAADELQAMTDRKAVFDRDMESRLEQVGAHGRKKS